VALVVVVQLTVGWRELLSAWEGVPITTLAGATALVFSSYVLRSLRAQHYFGAATSGQYLANLRIFLIHNLLNNFLPFRSGEISFPVMMKRAFDIPMVRSIPGLMYLRILDVYTIIALGVVVIPWSDGPSRWLVPMILGAAPVTAFLGQERLRLAFAGRLGRFARIADAVVAGFPRTPASYTWIWLLTVANWVVKLLVLAAVLRMFVSLPYPDLLLGVVAGELTSSIPSGLAGAGIYEGGVVAILQLTGAELEAALAGAVNLHLFVLGVAVIGGLLALGMPSGSQSFGAERPRPVELAGDAR
jgi:uncharacterized membrane protein YbhN (UPF0104 family)